MSVMSTPSGGVVAESGSGREGRTMATTLDRVAQDIRERAAQVRKELAERERVYRAETEQLRDELARLDAALRAIGDEPAVPERRGAGSRASRARRGQNKAQILDMVAARCGVSAAEIAQATGIASATVSSTLAKMASSGQVVKEKLPSGGVGFALPTCRCRPPNRRAARAGSRRAVDERERGGRPRVVTSRDRHRGTRCWERWGRTRGDRTHRRISGVGGSELPGPSRGG